ncbi:MAG: NAD-dependent nucleoside-diphosphate sugar epimerase [Amycolatopsis sp.]|jgi:uncharacterized protein (TIGR01777 family)|uniref:TIGR01777 family oxidoreductase n=1 Tax=Amycolatopsis sp. TaxID=37632 RepID=UPI00262D183D|nr:TIGR01777 family oxidoreductase [Amycolatopsis sp.]MCU1687611.1 NAD-dependent nucleoside-diphosphate sugar epimerase [Amycolatopsis sp.]
MRVLIAGASGLIGDALSARLRETGHEVRKLVRRDPATPDEQRWDPPAGKIAAGALDDVDAVVNLCGAPLFPSRWSGARKQVLLDSRVEPTDVLAEAVAEHGIPVLVNASAVGYYGNPGSAVVDEKTTSGEGFLAELCVAWEAATTPATVAGARVVSIRTGLVLAKEGGLLATLKPLFWLALGSRLGSGKQYMPWISLEDEVRAIVFALENDAVSGPVNLSAPQPVTNIEFTKAFAQALHRPAALRVPGFALKLLLGQAGEEMALFGQRAVPRELEKAGFEFRHTDIAEAMSNAV